MPSNEAAKNLIRVKQIMECEGYPLTPQNETDILDVLQGNRTSQEVREDILRRNGLLSQ